MTEQDNNVTGTPRERHPHELPELPTLHGIRSIPRIKRDRGERTGFELDHTALRQVRDMNRRIADMRQSQAELLYPMYQAGVSTYILSRMTGLSMQSVVKLVRSSRQLDVGVHPMPDEADDNPDDFLLS